MPIRISAFWRATPLPGQSVAKPPQPRKRRFGYAVPLLLLGICVGCLTDSIDGDTATLFRDMLAGAIVGSIVGIIVDMRSSR